jgi:S1-C subfamily serine protease
MQKISRSLALILVLLSTILATPTTGLAQGDNSALFERTRPSVVEVVTQSRANLGLASTASGFVSHRKDWVITNYHAISDVVLEPEEYQLRITSLKEKGLKVQILAVDVVNDLAILKLDIPMEVPLLEIRETLPKIGEQGYSMGKPGSYQHSIVSGTFNGMNDESAVPNIIFSGAINGGMSGGPTLDDQGRVVGVNVASSSNDQLIGLAVPAEVLGRLIRKSTNLNPPEHAALLVDIAQQVAAFGGQLERRLSLPANKVRQLGPFSVAADFSLNKPCATTKISKADDFYKRIDQVCTASSYLYISDENYGAEVFSRSSWIHSSTMSAQQMARLVERRLTELRGSQEENPPIGRWQCTEQRLKGSKEVPIQLHACRRPLPKLPGLYDFRFRYVPLVIGQDALVVSIGMSGFDNASARAILQRNIQSLAFTPGTQP